VQKLRKTRKYKLGLTLCQMAELTGFSVTTLSQWETGRTEPTKKNLEKVSKTTGIPFEELYDDVGSVQRAS